MKTFIAFAALSLLAFNFGCSFQQQKSSKVRLFTLKDVGGLSGLTLLKESEEELTFLTHTDRGPNGSEMKDSVTGKNKRVFLKPEFQPLWITFSVNLKTNKVSILDEKSMGLSGIPNLVQDETPLDKKGKEIPLDKMGIDPESICIQNDFIWMGEEYRPSILKFTKEGKLVKRYVPKKSFSPKAPSLNKKMSQVLPEELKQRRINRGFEGIACLNDKVYAILQSPLDAGKKDVLLLEFNPRTEIVERQFYYPLDSLNADKIGDLAVKGNDFYIIEQNGETGSNSTHKVFRFTLDSADKNGRLKKELVIDLVKAGYDFAEKVEGLAVLNNNSLAVLNDNDFGLTGEQEKKTGEFIMNPSKKSVLGIIELKSQKRR